MNEMTIEIAEKALAGAERWARDVAGFPCSIAVVDRAGIPVAVHRMDGAAMLTVEIAIGKAWSAVAMQLPTLLLARSADPRSLGSRLGEHGMGMAGIARGRLVSVPGGIPITGDEGEIIGAIGASGVPQGLGDLSDTAVSQAGISALYD